MHDISFFAGNKDCSVSSEAADTADLFMFIDMLFDSVNGNSVMADKGKYLRCSISSTSRHIEFWNEALQVLKTFQFVDSEGRNSRLPSVKNWENTIKGLKIIWGNLQKKGFKFLSLRALNQDPLENFFGCIRSHGVRNIMPSSTLFTSSFKALLVNNFTSSRSVGANCMKDDTQGSLDTLRVFITETVPQHPESFDAGVSMDMCDIPCTYVDEPQCLGSDSSLLAAGTKCT